MKSAESDRKELLDRNQPLESCPEVDGVTYRPGFYKIPMVRMYASTDENRECTGLKVGRTEMCGGVNSPSVWFSQHRMYERPRCVTGTPKLTGLKRRPKGIWIDRIIGTRKGIGFCDIAEQADEEQ